MTHEHSTGDRNGDYPGLEGEMVCVDLVCEYVTYVRSRHRK